MLSVDRTSLLQNIPSFASKNNASSTETDVLSFAEQLTTPFSASTLFIFFKTKNNRCPKKQNSCVANKFILKCTSIVWGENRGKLVVVKNQTTAPWLELSVLWPLSNDHWATFTMLYMFLYHQLLLFTAETRGSNILFVSFKQLKAVDTYTGDLWLSSDLSVCVYRPYQGCGLCEMQCLTSANSRTL